MCTPFKQALDRKVTLSELAKDPAVFARFLLFLNAGLEREIEEHNPYDVRRLPLPKLISVLPKASTHWRSITIDEFRTSKACSKCQTLILTPASTDTRMSVLACSSCRTLWQRDINAARNMMTISISIWQGRERPTPFRRTTTTPPPPSSL